MHVINTVKFLARSICLLSLEWISSSRTVLFSTSSTTLNSLKSNALTLQTLDYLSQEELDQLIFDLSLSVTIMSRKDKNYNVAVLKLKSAFSTIHNKGKFSNSDFNIGFNTFSVPFSDL
mgnify:CR=1 FL=1